MKFAESDHSRRWALPDVDNYFQTTLKPEGFEIDHLLEALKFCRKFDTAIDGGAHIGTWTVCMSHRFRRVISFEPASDTFACLVRNALSVNAELNHAALGPVSGRCTLIDDPMRIGNTGARVTFYGAGDIPVIAIDDLGLSDLDFLKLDLEGCELSALRGALKTIERCKPTIMVECKEFNPPRNGGVAATKDHLQSLSYKEVGGIRNDKVFVPT